MADIKWSTEDFFSFPATRGSGENYGIVTGNGFAVTIEGAGGRSGWIPRKRLIPKNAVPAILGRDKVRYEVRLALLTVAVSLKESRNYMHVR